MKIRQPPKRKISYVKADVPIALPFIGTDDDIDTISTGTKHDAEPVVFYPDIPADRGIFQSPSRQIISPPDTNYKQTDLS